MALVCIQFSLYCSLRLQAIHQLNVVVAILLGI